MFVKRLSFLKAVCPHCGAEITLSNDEYLKYRKEVEDYGGSVITCQKRDENDRNSDVDYTNMDCPVCKGYIPMTVSDGVDSDIFGFCFSKCVTPIYDSSKEIKIDDYIKDFFGGDEEEDDEEFDDCTGIR